MTNKYTPKTEAIKYGDSHQARVTIGVQTFTICERDTKEAAEWYCKMMDVALENTRKECAIYFSKFLSGFKECKAGWLKKFESPDDKEKFYTIEEVYEMFKKQQQ